jgi:hypothetical protein
MTLTVITAYSVVADGPNLRVTITTDTPVTYWLCITNTQPTHRAKHKRRRGVTYICGFTTLWRDPICTLQTEPGPSTTHTWTIPRPTPTTAPWGTFAEAPDLIEGTSAYPAINLKPTETPMPLPAIALANLAGQSIGVNANPYAEYDTMLWTFDWPAPSLPANALEFPIDGIVIVTISLGISRNNVGSLMLSSDAFGPNQPSGVSAANSLASPGQARAYSQILAVTAGDIYQFAIRQSGDATLTTFPTGDITLQIEAAYTRTL